MSDINHVDMQFNRSCKKFGSDKTADRSKLLQKSETNVKHLNSFWLGSDSVVNLTFILPRKCRLLSISSATILRFFISVKAGEILSECHIALIRMRCRFTRRLSRILAVCIVATVRITLRSHFLYGNRMAAAENEKKILLRRSYGGRTAYHNISEAVDSP